MPLVPGLGGAPGERRRRAARRRRGRLSRAAQGGLGRRRARHAPGRRALRARGGLRDCDRRGRGGLRRRRALPREDRGRRAPHRGAGRGRRRRRRARRGRARVQRAAPPPEAARGVALAVHQRGGARAALRRRARRRARDALPQCRHDRVPARRRPVLLLHGDEHAAPGRASGERGGDRHRPRAHAAAPRHGRAAAGAGHRADARPRHRVPHQRRGPVARVHAVARAAAPLPPAARARRARRHARLRGLHRAADLRLARGQADRLRRHAYPGARARRAGARGIRGRGHLDDAAALPRDGRRASRPSAPVVYTTAYLEEAAGRLSSLSA